MEFDKNRVYTAVNADELRVGSIIVVAGNLENLERKVENSELTTLVRVESKGWNGRFYAEKTHWYLAYLVDVPEEKKLHWYDLKVGDIIRKKFYDGYRTAMVTVVDTCTDTTKHVGLSTTWLDDTEIEDWEKVED